MATATFVYNVAKEQLLDGDLDPSADTLACTLLMLNTTADDEYDVTTMTGVGGFTTLGEHTVIAASVSTLRKALVSVAMGTKSPGISGYSFIDSDDPVFAAPLVNGASNTIACLLYKIVAGSAPEGTDGSNVPIAFYYLGEFTTGASTITIQWSDTGFLQIN
jgi:hypothetical protein